MIQSLSLQISVTAGAFYPGVPVQPVCVRYPNRLVCKLYYNLLVYKMQTSELWYEIILAFILSVLLLFLFEGIKTVDTIQSLFDGEKNNNTVKHTNVHLLLASL